MSKYSPNKVSIVLTITGLALLGISVVADKMGIGGAPGFGSRQIVLLTISLFTVVVGGGWMLVDLFGSRSTSSLSTFPNSRFQRSAVKAAGLSALGIGAIILVEVLLRIGFFVNDTVFMKSEPNVGLSAYDVVAYDADLLKQESVEGLADLAYQPYTVWSRRPYDGELINVDENGDRVTHNNSIVNGALELWMFGGSTTWGTGAPDAETIASYLARMLNDWGVESAVRNYVETAYVSTQELVHLQRKLQSGRVPSIVLFYDGINDAASSAEAPQEFGAHLRVESIRAKVERQDKVISLEVDLPAILSRTAFFRFASAIGGEAGSAGSEELSPLISKYIGSNAETSPETNEYAENALAIMKTNYRSVEGLGKEYGFKPLFFLQPSLLTGNRLLNSDEQRILENILLKRVEKGEASLIHSQMGVALREAVEEGDWLARVYDLTGTFDDVTDPVFVDWVHVTGLGNQVVAKRILEILQTEVCSNPPPNVSIRSQEQLAIACANQS